MPNLTPWMLLTFVAIFALCLCGFCGHMRIKRLREEREEEQQRRCGGAEAFADHGGCARAAAGVSEHE